MKTQDNDYDRLNHLISKNLRSQRLAQKFSQGELVAKIKVSCQQVAKYELGINRISAVRLALASKALNVLIESFFKLCDLKLCDLSKKHEERFLKIAKLIVEIADRHQQDALCKLVKTMTSSRPTRLV